MRRTWTKQRPLILVLDDDAITRKMVCSRVKAFADVIEAGTQEIAEALLVSHEIDLAIVDLELQTGTGTDFMRTLRSLASNAWIPIIVLTGSEDRQSLEQSLNAGATSFLVKPLNWNTFGRHIQQVSEIAFRAGYMALHDHLTGLPNRVQLGERLARICGTQSHSTMLTTFALDLDRFKPVNDIHGHFVGDQVLIEVARRLRQASEMFEIVARVGGDEFMMVSTVLSDPESVGSTAQLLIDLISAPYHVGGQSIVIGTSIGIDCRQVGDDAIGEQVLRNADLALGQAKKSGRNTFRLFEQEMSTSALIKTAIEQNIRQAIDAKQFEVHYQPIENIRTGEVMAFGALLRWRHPALGFIAPGQFIPIAEESGLIAEIGGWVLEEACAAAMRFPKPCNVSINVSALQIHKRVLERQVEAALSLTGLPPQRLELEIVESVLLDGSGHTLATLKALHRLGARIVLDDFGTGYSSLGYLSRFPFQKIKIDRSFVASAPNHPGARSVITAVSSLARGYSMMSTAEGVETAAQKHLLADEGIDLAQGFYVGRPMPETQVYNVLGGAVSVPKALVQVGR